MPLFILFPHNCNYGNKRHEHAQILIIHSSTYLFVYFLSIVTWSCSEQEWSRLRYEMIGFGKVVKTLDTVVYDTVYTVKRSNLLPAQFIEKYDFTSMTTSHYPQK